MLLMQAITAIAAMLMMFAAITAIGAGINVFRAGLDYCARPDLAIVRIDCAAEGCAELDALVMQAAVNRMSYDAAEANLARLETCSRRNPLKLG